MILIANNDVSCNFIIIQSFHHHEDASLALWALFPLLSVQYRVSEFEQNQSRPKTENFPVYPKIYSLQTLIKSLPIFVPKPSRFRLNWAVFFPPRKKNRRCRKCHFQSRCHRRWRRGKWWRSSTPWRGISSASTSARESQVSEERKESEKRKESEERKESEKRKKSEDKEESEEMPLYFGNVSLM